MRFGTNEQKYSQWYYVFVIPEMDEYLRSMKIKLDFGVPDNPRSSLSSLVAVKYNRPKSIRESRRINPSGYCAERFMSLQHVVEEKDTLGRFPGQ